MKYFNVVKKVAAPAVGAGVLLATDAAMATGTDYSALTSAADWSSVATGVITVFAAGAAVIVAFVGGKFLLRALRGA